jgi:hypothetical protein
MKTKSFLIAGIMLIALNSFAKNNNCVNVNSNTAYAISTKAVAVPPAVTAAFNSQFPNATRVVWRREDKNRWEADFYIGIQNWVALYDSNGSLIFTRKTK